MCNCEKPTVNGEQGYRWNFESPHVRQPNPPELGRFDEVLYDLPGRCGQSCDSHSYHFTIVERSTSIILRVRHGGGDESFNISSTISPHKRFLFSTIKNAVDDDERYWIVQNLYHIMKGIAGEATTKERERWQKAATEGRLKIRSRKRRKFAEILPS